MPGGDGTGPAGMGPRSGRSAGYCAGYAAPGYANPGPGFGRGGGRGWRNWFRATGAPGWARAAQGYPAWGSGRGWRYWSGPAAQTPEQELEWLRNEAQALDSRLGEIKNRMQSLEQEIRDKDGESTS
jgi:hypothetical protein